MLRLDVALAHLGQLHDGDDAGQRGVLHQRDDLIGHRRHNALHHLQQGDLKEDLPAGEAQYLSRLPLPGRHALNAAPVDDGEVAGIVYHKRHGAGKQTLCAPYVLTEPEAGAVIDNDELKHERCATHDKYIEICQPRDRLEAAFFQHCHKHSHRY